MTFWEIVLTALPTIAAAIVALMKHYGLKKHAAALQIVIDAIEYAAVEDMSQKQYVRIRAVNRGPAVDDLIHQVATERSEAGPLPVVPGMGMSIVSGH